MKIGIYPVSYSKETLAAAKELEEFVKLNDIKIAPCSTLEELKSGYIPYTLNLFKKISPLRDDSLIKDTENWLSKNPKNITDAAEFTRYRLDCFGLSDEWNHFGGYGVEEDLLYNEITPYIESKVGSIKSAKELSFLIAITSGIGDSLGEYYYKLGIKEISLGDVHSVRQLHGLWKELMLTEGDSEGNDLKLKAVSSDGKKIKQIEEFTQGIRYMGNKAQTGFRLAYNQMHRWFFQRVKYPENAEAFLDQATTITLAIYLFYSGKVPPKHKVKDVGYDEGLKTLSFALDNLPPAPLNALSSDTIPGPLSYFT